MDGRIKSRRIEKWRVDERTDGEREGGKTDGWRKRGWVSGRMAKERADVWKEGNRMKCGLTWILTDGEREDG